MPCVSPQFSSSVAGEKHAQNKPRREKHAQALSHTHFEAVYSYLISTSVFLLAPSSTLPQVIRPRLLKYLAALCMLDCVGALPSSPSPKFGAATIDGSVSGEDSLPSTCGCSDELEAIYKFVGMTPPSPPQPPPSPPPPPLARDCASSPCVDGKWLTQNGIDCAVLRTDLGGGETEFLDGGGRRAGDSCCHFCPPASPPSPPLPSPPKPSPPPLSPSPPSPPSVRDCAANPCTDGYWLNGMGANCAVLRDDLFGGDTFYDATTLRAGDFGPVPRP